MRTGKGFRAAMAAAVMAGSLALSLAAGAPAGAGVEVRPPEVYFVASTVTVRNSSPDTARVIGVYRCFGGQPIHLWVSVKQGGPDPSAEGSGATSTSWYDTNIAGAPPVICDGRYHALSVNVGRYPDKAQLQSGQAWVQFCLVDENGIVASQQKFIRVLRY